MRAWRHIGGRPLPNSTALKARDTLGELEATSSWPKHKQDCFDLCVLLVLSDLHPNPSIRMWFKLSFGFCTTQRAKSSTTKLQLGLAGHELFI
jgi:hypothetical protein